MSGWRGIGGCSRPGVKGGLGLVVCRWSALFCCSWSCSPSIALLSLQVITRQ